MLSLPRIPQSALEVRPIDWSGLTRRFMNEGELETLIALLRPLKPRSIAEFGVNEGRTARAILDNIPGIERYDGVDVLPGYVFEKKVQRGEIPGRPGHLARGDHRFTLLLCKRGTLDLQPRDFFGWPYDAVFIDGDHSRAAVEHDTRLARQLLRPGGLIIWHDYHDLGTVDVRDVLHEMQAQGAALTHVEGTWLVFMTVD